MFQCVLQRGEQKVMKIEAVFPRTGGLLDLRIKEMMC